MKSYPIMTQSENNKLIVYMTSIHTGIVINNMRCKRGNSYLHTIGTYISYWNDGCFKTIRHMIVPINSRDFNIISTRLDKKPDGILI